MAFAAEEKLGSTSRTGQPGRPGRAFDDRRQHVRGPVSGLASARKAAPAWIGYPWSEAVRGVPITVRPVQPCNAR
jgi:hypothetical protein